MRTDAPEVFRGSLKGSRLLTISSHPEASHTVDLSRYSTKANGSSSETPKAPVTLSRIFTFILRPGSWFSSLSSPAAKRLKISYWIFTVLCCITFFTSPWYLFLAFLIPALAMKLILLRLEILTKHWHSSLGASTNGI